MGASRERDVHLLWLNLATDEEDPILGFTTAWIRALAKRVAFIHVITMRAGRVDVPDNVSLYSVGKEKGYGKLRRAVVFYKYLFHILRHERPNACFSHMIPIFSILAGPIVKVRGIPLVTWFAHPSLTRTLKLAHRLSDRMVTSLGSAYPYRHDKLVIIGQGVDTDLFCLDDRSVPDKDPIVVLCVGRLSPVKDHTTLLKAVALLQQCLDKPLRFVILGGTASSQDEGYVRLLREKIKELKIEDKVHFEPPVRMAELPTWYRRCKVHVNLTPSGFGDKVAWEAMACGRPCLVANEGFKETLGLYWQRLLFHYGDPEDLAEKLVSLLELSEKELEDMGLYLRQKVIQLHSLERLSEKLLTVIRMLQIRKN